LKKDRPGEVSDDFIIQPFVHRSSFIVHRSLMSAVFENSSETPIPTHLSVLPDETLAALAPERGGWFVDCTTGLGGHTEALLRSNDAVRVVAIDRDRDALGFAARRLAPFEGRVTFVHRDYRELPDVLDELNLPTVTGILADLGVSSWQLDDAERGFSFQRSGALDMRMDRTQMTTAAKLVNGLPERELADVIFEYGEERYSRKIARRIVEARRVAPIETTAQLAEIVRKCVPVHGKQRIDPATRTFQAIRIAVNRELDELDDFVAGCVERLAPGGRLAIISFHSLEDRIIKHAMRREAGMAPEEDTPTAQWEWQIGKRPEPRVKLVTRKPVIASEVEQAANPRSRSAKLRVCEKIGSGVG
jgi:16S rRNA (cytosine1402-N4)-methyltransferase